MKVFKQEQKFKNDVFLSGDRVPVNAEASCPLGRQPEKRLLIALGFTIYLLTTAVGSYLWLVL